MDIFPVQYSTLSAKALGDRIGAHYGIPVLQCKYLLRGVSDTYVITAVQDKFIFKVYRGLHRSLQEIKGEIELMETLIAGGARVVRPIPATNGTTILALQAPEGMRHGVLFSFAKGKALMAFDSMQLEIIGREMAFNHNITAGLELQWERKAYNTQTTVQQPLERLKPAFDEYYPEGYEMLQHTSAGIMRKLATFNTDAFASGYCHYDYFPHNFFFDEEQQFTLFDFDFAGKGFLAYDLATLFVHFFFDTHYRKKTRAELESEFSQIVAGYRKLRMISEEELAAMPLLAYQLLLFYLDFQYDQFDDWSNPFFGARYLKERVGIMEKLAVDYCGLEQ